MPASSGLAPADGSYLGLMSGTSLDAVDGALVRWQHGVPQTLAFDSEAFSDGDREALMSLQAPGPNELHRAAMAGQLVAKAYARIATRLLAKVQRGQSVVAIGAHGQTVRHRPELGYTVQLLDGALLAELTRCPVVCDFRSADIAAGGQGAPLVPAFHHDVFASSSQRRAIVNLGGIANVSLLAPGEPARGFDTGPANVLLDLWAQRALGHPIDRDGALAARGQVRADLLALLLSEPYFARPAPKSTGRDLFNTEWLDQRLADWGRVAGLTAPWPEADVQATLVELTATTVGTACREFGAQAVYLCGGGAANPVLRERLENHCSPADVFTTDALGAAPQAVEAVAFAWLARCRLAERAGNLPAVTGARGPRILGALYLPPSG